MTEDGAAGHDPRIDALADRIGQLEQTVARLAAAVEGSLVTADERGLGAGGGAPGPPPSG